MTIWPGLKQWRGCRQAGGDESAGLDAYIEVWGPMGSKSESSDGIRSWKNIIKSGPCQEVKQQISKCINQNQTKELTIVFSNLTILKKRRRKKKEKN